MRRRVTLALLCGAVSAALAMAAAAPPSRMFDPPARQPQVVPDAPPAETPPARRPARPGGTLSPRPPIVLPDTTPAMVTSNDIAVTVTVIPGGEIQPSPATPTFVFALEQNTPNPVVTSTTLRFSVAKDTHVQIELFSITGQRMAVPVDRDYAAGSYAEPWNGAGVAGRRLPAGMYVMRMLAGSFSAKRKVLITP